MRRSYWQAVIVCLVVAVLVGWVAQTRTSAPGVLSLGPMGGLQLTHSDLTDVLIKNIFGVERGELWRLTAGKTGIFATLFDNITSSGSFLFGLVNAVNQGIFGGKLMIGVVIFAGACVMGIHYVFVSNVLLVGRCRIFMELKNYPKTEVNRLLCVYKVGKTANVAKVMLVKAIYLFLWSCTVVGGIIKVYSYRMVPYILAENPGISAKAAIRLSREMMQGNKWRTFVLDCTFLPWLLASYLTLGLVERFFLTPYTQAVGAELYAVLRAEYLAKHPEAREVLGDSYLFIEQVPACTVYPEERFAYPAREGRRWITANFRRSYGPTSIVLMFFALSMIGWIWEVSLHLMTHGVFVNRGTLYGPWLPIYGTGGTLVLLLLRRFSEKPALTFSLTVLLCGSIEYVTAWVLETQRGVKWWDYSNMLFNVQGRICLEGLLFFGIGGCLLLYYLAPMLDDLLRKLPRRAAYALCALLLVCFLGDVIFSHLNPHTGEGITEPLSALLGQMLQI